MRLLSAPLVVPIAAAPIADGAIVLDETEAIVAVGPRAELRQRFPAAPEDRGEGALLPALVNAHVHLELSALAGRVPGGAGFVPWALAVGEVARTISDEERRTAAIRAAQEAVAAGTAAVGDVANALDASVAALAATGLRGVVFHELLGSRDTRTGDALADAAIEREAHAPRWPSGVAYVPAPHAPYSASPSLFRRIFSAARDAGRATSVHVAEDADELLLLRDGSGRWAPILDAMGVARGERTPGMSPVAYLASLGAFEGGPPPLLVHMVHAVAEDVALARRHGATVVLCPRSNLHVGGRLPDVRRLLAEPLSLALGTDSLASTPSLSLWGEIATLATRLPDVPPETWLRAATLGGAQALGLPGMGALAPGARPGIIDVPVGDATAPLRSLVTNPDPRPRWMARA